MWLPQTGKPNQISVDQEKFMKYTVTDLEGSNELIDFTNNIIENYSAESFLGSFNAQRSLFLDNVVVSQIKKNSHTDPSKCLNFIDKFSNNSPF